MSRGSSRIGLRGCVVVVGVGSRRGDPVVGLRVWRRTDLRCWLVLWVVVRRSAGSVVRREIARREL